MDLELTLKPIEVVFRANTFSHLNCLASKLAREKHENAMDNSVDSLEKSGHAGFISAVCTISSLTVTLPVGEEHDLSPLYSRNVQCFFSHFVPLGFFHEFRMYPIIVNNFILPMTAFAS